MFSFRGRPAVFYDIVDDGGGNGGGKKYGLSNVKNALQGVVDAVSSAVANGQGTPTANANGLSNVAGAVQGIVNGVKNAAGAKAGDAKITNKNTGRSGGTATYIGSNGQKQTGTVKVKPGQTPDFYNQMGEFYRKAYEDQVAANAADLAAAEQRAREATDEQIAALADQYAGTNRQLYRDYMESRRTLPQRLAAQGFNGGLSESSMLRLNNSYEEGLNENERARIAQVSEYQRQLAQDLYDAAARTRESDRSAKTTYDSQLAALQEAIFRDQQQRAATMAAAGDFTEYERLGYSPEEIAYLKALWRKANPALA